MSNQTWLQQRVEIPPVGLVGELVLPREAKGLILFAHGSGSSRHSPRNRYVAEQLREADLGTLLFDLLTRQEEQADEGSGRFRFDIDLLADRLVAATDWVKSEPELAGLRPGYFGASTGGGAALVAAALRPLDVFAVVSRGGRPDLAGRWLLSVNSPTLLIVGGQDAPVIELNKQALQRIPAIEKRLEIVPGATHLFEEPGTLERVAVLAREWFRHCLK